LKHRSLVLVYGYGITSYICCVITVITVHYCAKVNHPAATCCHYAKGDLHNFPSANESVNEAIDTYSFLFVRQVSFD